MNECVVITSYCNNQERVDELIKCINNLNSFGVDILLHAHYPLDLSVQKLVKYYIYDSTNPIIKDGSKVIVRWKWYKSDNKLLTISNPDYSYAVMNQWVESFNFLKAKGYNIIHVINYDTFINEFVFNKHREFLNDYDAVFEYTSYKARDYNANEYSKGNLLFVLFFSIKGQFIDTFKNELTLEKYLQSKDTMLEPYIMEVLEKIENRNKNISNFIGLDGFKIKKYDDSQFKLYLGDAVPNPPKKEDCDVYSTVSEANGFDLIRKNYIDENGNEKEWYYLFGAKNEENNKFEIYLFEISKPIDKITINIDDKIINYIDIKEKHFLIPTDYTLEEIIKLIDNDKLNIVVNDENVNKKVINAMKNHSIKNKYE